MSSDPARIDESAEPKPGPERSNLLLLSFLWLVAITLRATGCEGRGCSVNAAGEVGLNVGVVGPCADLRDQALAGESFDRMDLRGARFDGAGLEGATFTGANLSRAVLTGAKLDGARLDRVELRQAHLEHAQLAGTDLRGSDLRLSCLFHARFDGTDLRGTRFSNSKPLLYGASFAKVVIDAATVLPGMTVDQVMVAAR
jgi:uncharacterized protein YjbI with pentapeptide repeats